MCLNIRVPPMELNLRGALFSINYVIILHKIYVFILNDLLTNLFLILSPVFT